MAQLTKDQKVFLAHNDIPLSWLFDASRLARHECSEIMRAEDKYFAYGVKECRTGHTLSSRPSSSRGGNCIQCNPATIAFVKRHYTSADVYIAGSMVGQLIKIGLSTEAENRLYIANLDGYAGCNDWKPLFRIYVKQSGKIEDIVKSKLRQYQRLIDFVRNGTRRTAKEVFACSYKVAYAELEDTLRSFGIFDGKQWCAERHILDNY